MRFRYFNIPKLIFQLVRPNFAIRYDYDGDEQPNILNGVYRLCLAICWAIKGDLDEYYSYRSRWYLLASCTPTYGHVERVLNYLYNYSNQITITPSQASLNNSYLYDTNTPAQYLYATNTPPVYWGMGGNYSEQPIVNVPQALRDSVEWEQFIADLNLLFPFYLSYTINVI